MAEKDWFQRGVWMADKLSPEKRSWNMSRVRNRDTGPEKRVRQALFSAGFRFRLHSETIPGCPDIVLPRFRVAVFVHGCFWHGHECPRGRRPASNVAFWAKKIDRNIARDREVLATVRKAGWKPKVIWQCDLERATDRLIRSLYRAARRVPAGRIAVSRYPAKELSL